MTRNIVSEGAATQFQWTVLGQMLPTLLLHTDHRRFEFLCDAYSKVDKSCAYFHDACVVPTMALDHSARASLDIVDF